MSDVASTRHKLVGFEDLMTTIVYESGDGLGICKRTVRDVLSDFDFLERFRPAHAARIGAATVRAAIDDESLAYRRSLAHSAASDQIAGLRDTLGRGGS